MKSLFSETKPLCFCKSRGLHICRKALKPIAYSSPGAEPRRRMQCWWVLGGMEARAVYMSGAEWACCFEPRLPLSVPHWSMGTHTRKPSASSFHLGLMCGCRMFFCSCWIHYDCHIQLHHHMWGQEAVWGGARAICMKRGFWLAPAHTMLLPYEAHHLLVVVSFVDDDFLFCFAWHGMLLCNLRWPQTIIVIFLPHSHAQLIILL